MIYYYGDVMIESLSIISGVCNWWEKTVKERQRKREGKSGRPYEEGSHGTASKEEKKDRMGHIRKNKNLLFIFYSKTYFGMWSWDLLLGIWSSLNANYNSIF